MATHEAIADAGETIVAMLRDRMGDLIDEDEVALASPGGLGPGDDVRLTLYLYRVSENGHLKNAEREQVTANEFEDSPLALDLLYLLTAHPSKGGNDPTAKTQEQHSVLGRAMQVMRDNAILRGSDLSGSLAGGPNLYISLLPMDPETADQVASIWNTFSDNPFQPSVSYLVGPVLVESTREETVQRVVRRDAETYHAEVEDAER